MKGKMSLSGDTITGDVTLANASKIIFESTSGSQTTNIGFETGASWPIMVGANGFYFDVGGDMGIMDSNASPVSPPAASATYDPVVSFWDRNWEWLGWCGFGTGSGSTFLLATEVPDGILEISTTNASQYSYTVSMQCDGTNKLNWMRDGVALRISNSADTDWVQMGHDGTDFNIAGTNTTDINFTGITAVTFSAKEAFKVSDTWLRLNDSGDFTSGIYTASSTVRVDGKLWLIDDVKASFGDTDDLEIYHTAAGSSVLNHVPTTGSLYFMENGVAKMELNHTSSYFVIRDGYELRLMDTADTDEVSWKHNGTDVLADYHSAARFHRFNGLTDSVRIESGATLKINETSAAQPDNAAYGQIWVKNTTPCQLWFTDDAGTDTQIV